MTPVPTAPPVPIGRARARPSVSGRVACRLRLLTGSAAMAAVASKRRRRSSAAGIVASTVELAPPSTFTWPAESTVSGCPCAVVAVPT